MADDDSWPDRCDEYGTHVGSQDPVTIRVGTYRPNDDPDGDSPALCTSEGRPILLNERSARMLGEELVSAANDCRRDVRRRQQWRQAAARDLIDGAVLCREQWQQIRDAVKDSDSDGALTDMLNACAPESWRGTKSRQE